MKRYMFNHFTCYYKISMIICENGTIFSGSWKNKIKTPSCLVSNDEFFLKMTLCMCSQFLKGVTRLLWAYL